MRLFRACRALVLCYDNYQKGVTLQHQRGKHSSAFFKGTHQCGHKVEEYDNVTFDVFKASFTQLDQDIPSPDGMPTFELADLENPASFFWTTQSLNLALIQILPATACAHTHHCAT